MQMIINIYFLLHTLKVLGDMKLYSIYIHINMYKLDAIRISLRLFLIFKCSNNGINMEPLNIIMHGIEYLSGFAVFMVIN